jgi:hypothetical protein
MKKLSRLGLLSAILAGALASNGVGLAEDVLRLRVIDSKPFYKPGDRIALEMRCPAGVTDVFVWYDPISQDFDPDFIRPANPKCPLSRLEIQIPRDFIGKNQVTVLAEYRDQPLGDMFEFEVRSDAQPSDLWFSTDYQNEGCHLSYFHAGSGPRSLVLFSVLPNGTRFDLCREGKVILAAVPPGRGVFDMKDHLCTFDFKKPGPLKIVASYRGLRKEWPCKNAEPPKLHPAKKTISVEEFLKDPRKLDQHPVEIGLCRTMEHRNTGYCYVYKERFGKVSVDTDDRCDNLQGLRDRMLKAIREGYCDPPPAVAAVISISAFRNDPKKLDRNPMDVGKCRLLQHHNTGYCYIYSLPKSRKVSEPTDVRCTELDELRRRMAIAIDQGQCVAPAARGSAGENPQ